MKFSRFDCKFFFLSERSIKDVVSSVVKSILHKSVGVKQLNATDFRKGVILPCQTV